MAKAKNLQIGNNIYTIRDANTYRSLSSAQANTLVTDGTYNGEDIDSGEIFVCDDGNVKEYTEVNQGVGLDEKSFESYIYPCNTYVVENGVNVLYATIGEDNTPNLLKSTDGGKNWTSVSSGRTSGTDRERIYYYDGTFYIIRSDTGGSKVYLDISTDNFQTWNSYLVANTWRFNYPHTFYLAKLNGYIIVGETRDGNAFVADVANAPSTWTQTYPSSNVRVFNGMFVTNTQYSTDNGANWESNGMDYIQGDILFANNKMYIQRNESGGTWYESSDGMSFSSFSNVGFIASSFATHQGSDLIFAFTNGTLRVASITNGITTWTTLTTSWYYASSIVAPFDDVVFAFTSESTTYPVTRGEYGTVWERSLSVLNIGSGVPDSSTEGYVGKVSVDSSGNAYMCVGVSGSTYTWKQITLTSI